MTRPVKILLLVILVLLVAAGLLAATIFNHGSQQKSSVPKTEKPMNIAAEDTAPAEVYAGKNEAIADVFSVNIPNGWKASIADTGSFQAIMFARPEQLSSLAYSKPAQPIVDRGGIPAWSGLTEHFYIRSVQASQKFDSSIHKEVSSQPFTFNDGTLGTMYYIVKHTEEAKQYGGLLRDDEWQGRVYVYEKNGIHVEAHLALYPSSTVDTPFYESVVRSITLSAT